MFNRNTAKKLLIIAHDMAMTALAVIATLALRFEGPILSERFAVLSPFLPGFLAVAGVIYTYFHLYQGKWRFASMPDLITIAKAVGVICLLLICFEFAALHLVLEGNYFLGRRVIIIYWLIQCALLGAPRLMYRYWKDRFRIADQRKDATFALLLGRGSEVEIIIRALEANKKARIIPVAILSPRAGDLGQSIRNVRVEGGLDQLDDVVRKNQVAGTPISRLLATPSALDDNPEALLAQAHRLGLPLARLHHVGEADAAIAPIEIEDLLSRPPVDIDPALLERSVKGKTVIVTGGGGSIGAQICLCCLALGAKQLVVLDHSEAALHAAMETLALQAGTTRLSEYLCDIRDRERLMQLMAEIAPDVVFHAAALKQVPYLERDWAEGIRTNAFGSIHVADAAIAAQAAIVVMISTDKAVQPVSVLGATKRFAEIAMEARDAAERQKGGKTRLISVRFGNVLGSSGSVIPRFKAQIARGGPVTVTHPDMVRYFMTISEAANLVMVAASHALMEGESDKSTHAPVSVYVLRMGQPVRILDLAERMVRLSGYDPHREIPILTTGIRPGERLNEILFTEQESLRETGIEGVMAAETVATPLDDVNCWLEALQNAVQLRDRTQAEVALKRAIADFSPAPISPAPPNAGPSR